MTQAEPGFALITAAEVVEGYRQSGWRPVRRVAFRLAERNLRHWCDGVVAAAIGRGVYEDAARNAGLQLNRKDDPARGLMVAAHLLNVPQSYAMGFIHGWDNSPRSRGRGQAYLDGFRDGQAAAAVVFDPADNLLSRIEAQDTATVARVKRGAGWLDQQSPGWADGIKGWGDFKRKVYSFVSIKSSLKAQIEQGFEMDDAVEDVSLFFESWSAEMDARAPNRKVVDQVVAPAKPASKVRKRKAKVAS